MANVKPRVLIYGTFGPQNFEYCWLTWLQNHNYPAQALDQKVILEKYVRSYSVYRLLWHFFQRVLIFYAGRELTRAAIAFQPNLVIVVSGSLISANALQTIRQKANATLFHFYGEDFFNPLNTNKNLRESAFVYDHLFTTKSFNVSELAEIGLSRVSVVPHGYRPNCHFPVAISQTDRYQYGSDMVFVGTYEAERATDLAQLNEFDLRIWGDAWRRARRNPVLDQAIQGRGVYCTELSKVFNASKICLAFLRKANRDRHTSRTFEIPACGGFQLSERTEEVLSFFDEGKEIECFDSVAELKDKARYYLKHEIHRQRIAAAGLARVQRSRYSYTDRLQTILECYSQMRIV